MDVLVPYLAEDQEAPKILDEIQTKSRLDNLNDYWKRDFDNMGSSQSLLSTKHEHERATVPQPNPTVPTRTRLQSMHRIAIQHGKRGTAYEHVHHSQDRLPNKTIITQLEDDDTLPHGSARGRLCLDLQSVVCTQGSDLTSVALTAAETDPNHVCIHRLFSGSCREERPNQSEHGNLPATLSSLRNAIGITILLRGRYVHAEPSTSTD
ncbi:expressed unknown protein [Seminavis robusta]|uniref:Uncharacterized protein n=1 Tax=Seminavis robusta TaxID=568900 RepID=A0A9N8DHD0_9STRA|nr:expressed unknown protein [Seminavis robusta]|eukprot:Sro122_g059090.1 n/a (208) ;mRNA; f:19588-20211